MGAHASSKGYSAKPVAKNPESQERQTERQLDRQERNAITSDGFNINLRPDSSKECYICGRKGHITRIILYLGRLQQLCQ